MALQDDVREIINDDLAQFNQTASYVSIGRGSNADTTYSVKIIIVDILRESIGDDQTGNVTAEAIMAHASFDPKAGDLITANGYTYAVDRVTTTHEATSEVVHVLDLVGA